MLLLATGWGCGDGAGSNGQPDAGIPDAGDATGEVGDTGDAGDTAGGAATLVVTSALPEGDDRCPAGGALIEVGLDNGDGGGTAGDGVLQPGEVDETETACNQEPGDLLATTSDVPVADANCPFGGTRVDVGLDNGDGGETPDDGTLGEGEIDESVYACNDAESGLLVEVTDLLWGDAECPTGGQRIESGLDNGDGGETPDDGVLAPGEIDSTLVRCNVEIDDVFPAPEGPAGSLVLDTSGGSSLNVDGSGGDAGDVRLELFAGPLPAAVELRENGQVDAGFDVPAVDPDLGDHSATISENSTVPTFNQDGEDDPPAELHLRIGGGIEAPYPLYIGTARATGIHVEEGVTLTFQLGSVLLDGDLWNEGTITPLTPGGNLEINVANLWNTATGSIDARASGQSGRLELYAVVGETASIYNQGDILTRGVDATEEAGAGDSALLTMVARGEVVNSGTISSRGGDGTTSFAGTAGSTLELSALAGDIRNGGTIESRGGRGQGGANGGRLALRTAVALPSVPDPGAFFEPETAGPGGLLHTGLLDSSGGDVVDGAAGTGGEGGNLEIALAGGDLRATGDILTRGGDTPSGNGGDAGNLGIDVFLWADPRSDAFQVPERLGFAADLDLSGGTSTTNGSGGRGGDLTMRVDLSLTLPDTDEPILEDDYPFVTPFDLGRLEGANDGVRLQLLGYGPDGDRNGPSLSGGSGIEGGAAGALILRNGVCVGSQPNCQLERIGARLVYNELDLDLTSASRVGRGDGGGDLTLVTESAANRLNARTDATLVVNHGALTVSGGDSSDDDGGPAGRITLASEAGDVVNDGDITGLGGMGSSGCCAGTGAEVTMVGVFVRQMGTLTVSGGNGEWGGTGGSVRLLGLETRNEGSIDVRGGSVEGESGALHGGSGGLAYLAGAGLVDNSAAIMAAGGAATSGNDATGGYAQARVGTLESIGAVTLVGRQVVNSGDLDASGGDAETTGQTADDDAFGGGGGSVLLSGEVVDNSGDISVASGEATGFEADSTAAGTIEIRGGVVSNQGVLDADGGAVTATGAAQSAFSGAGGEVLVAGDNAGAIRASGGEAIGMASTFGGQAEGGVTILGENTAPVTAAGGHATSSAGSANGGFGGRVTIGGPNSNPIDVAGGLADGATSGSGGEGGAVDVGALNSAAISADGGNADGTTSAFGGTAGEVTVDADNTGDIAAAGGDATGDGSSFGGSGGRIEIDGDNGGCLDVAAGAGANGDPDPGTIVVGGVDSGSCE